jgi:hypothetical protein
VGPRRRRRRRQDGLTWSHDCRAASTPSDRLDALRARCAPSRPSIWRWRDHSAGRSARRASGARKANEMVILTLRTLQPSRFAMLSAFAVGSVIELIEPAAAAGNLRDEEARFSERIVRASCCGGTDAGTRISRRRLGGVLCHGTFSTLRLRNRLEPIPLALVSSITS